ncbi:MAG: methylase involved in ubiquinone/menaquinone biosynthesis, partial [Clostridia bacterium]|nr:methylase involved in ubiquinone/menaquinone biosynthesis [Clostridia bacterium]
MNGALEKKLESVLNNIVIKLEENIDFFKSLNIEFMNKDGSNNKADIKLLNDKLMFAVGRMKQEMQPKELIPLIFKHGKSFDDCAVNYVERGTNITIWTEKNNVKIKYKETQLQDSIPHDNVTSRSNREYLVKVGEADELLREIGIISAEGKVKNDMIRKYNQIDRFVELTEGILTKLAEGKESITVLDCACGKSYLSFVLNYFIKEKLKKNCYFIGLAANLGYKNMEFLAVNIQNYMPSKEIDLVISLHGCDIATDMAIAAGIRYKAEAVVVIPCCQREILNQYEYQPFKEITKHGILKARLADVLTDGVRGMILESMGYEVSIVEYISPLDTPKNLMTRAIKQGGKNRKAYESYIELKESLGIEPTLARL